jgi:hypothetical protein
VVCILTPILAACSFACLFEEAINHFPHLQEQLSTVARRSSLAQENVKRNLELAARSLRASYCNLLTLYRSCSPIGRTSCRN